MVVKATAVQADDGKKRIQRPCILRLIKRMLKRRLDQGHGPFESCPNSSGAGGQISVPG
jgi:hypothetical protein